MAANHPSAGQESSQIAFAVGRTRAQGGGQGCLVLEAAALKKQRSLWMKNMRCDALTVVCYLEV